MTGSKRYNGLKTKVYLKVMAFILFMMSAGVAVVSLVAGMIIFDQNLYNTTEKEYREEIFAERAEIRGEYLLMLYHDGNQEFIERYCSDSSNLEFEVAHEYKTKDSGNWSQSVYDVEWVESEHGEKLQGKVFLDTKLPEFDEFYVINEGIEILYTIKNMIWVYFGVSLILAICLFIFLLCTAGYRKGNEKPVVCGTARIPWDVFTILMLCLSVPFLSSGFNSYYELSIWSMLMMGVLLYGMCILGTLYLMDLTVRIRTKTFVTNILTVNLLMWAYKKFHVIIKRLLKWGNTIIANFPLIWKGILIYTILNLGVIIVLLFDDFPSRFILLVLANIVLFPLFTSVCLMIKKLEEGSQKLRDGDLEHKISTSYMAYEFKNIAVNMNTMAEGMEKAVQEKMKSEHLKTELISNVSHDIKTPLTSIINYVDLIGKEPTENEKIHEYSAILAKQSERLKKLMEDLLHASKVTTGNVDVQLAPCDMNVLLTQVLGEYEDKFTELHLTCVTKQTEEPAMIMADSRHIWRVFDNLFNNICKYAQEYTRVYLTVEQNKQQVEVVFKNISKYELNVSEEELMERFVRGDSSRHSEGNGLGLSIAKSLAEVQGGTLKLSIDGDLFKVILQFPTQIKTDVMK